MAPAPSPGDPERVLCVPQCREIPPTRAILTSILARSIGTPAMMGVSLPDGPHS